jgi:hypothetical protein
VDISYQGEKIPEDEDVEIKKMIVNIVDAMALEITKVGFWGNAQKQKQLRGIIDDMILYSGVERAMGEKEKIVTDFMNLAKHRTKELVV